MTPTKSATKPKRSNARKTNAVPNRIMSYGCGPLSRETEEVIRPCVGRSVDYYNTLAKLNAARMDRFCAVRADAIPALRDVEQKIAEANTAIDAAYEALAADRARVRKRVMPQAALAEISRLKEDRKQLYVMRSDLAKGFAKFLKSASEELKLRKLRAFTRPDGSQIGPSVRPPITERILQEMLLDPQWPDEWKRVAEIDREHNLAGKAAYAPIDVWIYLMAKTQFAAAVKDTPGGVPREKRASGEGRIGIGIDPRSAADLFREGGALWLDPLPEDTWLTRSGRRHARTTAHITLNQKDGDPIKINLPIIMHRPLPEDAVIKTAWVLVRRVGRRMVCQLQMTIETQQMTRQNGVGAVALNLAWRKVEGGMRVGYWADTDGAHEEIVISERLLDAMNHPDALRSVSDRLFNEAVEFFSERLVAGLAQPPWMPEAIEHMAKWRGHGKLAAVVYRWVRELLPEEQMFALWKAWKEHRLAEGLDLFSQYQVMDRWFSEHGVDEETSRVALCLEWWRIKNRHLFDYEANQRDQALASRKDFYRCVAAKLSGRYGELVFDSTNLKELQDHPSPEEAVESWAAARKQRKFAAPSVLRDFCKEKFSKQTKVEAAGNSSDCADCGSPFIHNMNQHGTCSGCGVSRDADLNNCLNQLGRAGHRERPGGDKKRGGARKAEKRKPSGKLREDRGDNGEAARGAAE